MSDFTDSSEVILDDDQTTTGTRYRNLVVNPDVLDSSTVYRFELTVGESHRDDNFGFASLTLHPNRPPAGGSCDVSPRRGISLSTPFTFDCSGWIDDDSPLQYRFSTGQKIDTPRRDRAIIYRGHQNQYVSDILPAGSKDNNFTVYVFASVLDRFGQETEVEMQREVVVERLTNQSAFQPVVVHAFERIENVFAGDAQKLMETCGRYPLLTAQFALMSNRYVDVIVVF